MAAAGRESGQPAASRKVAAARAALDITVEEFAGRLSVLVREHVKPEAVQRWESGSPPPGNVVAACADICAGVPAPGLGTDGGDLVQPYSGRGLISREQWNGIIRGAADELWLYGMAELGYSSDDAVPGILADAAAGGCRVRILLLDPDCPAASDVDADEGSPAGTLPARIRASLHRFLEMSRPGIEVRTYGTHPTASIVRGDGEMLVTPYLRYTLGSNSPTFGFTAGSAPEMWERYRKHFESMWKNSKGAV